MLRTARILTALALVVLAPLEAMARWTELRSENFLFIGDAPERTIRAVAQKLEQFREVMVRVLPETTMASPVPTVVVVFGGHRSFAPYRPEFRGRPVELAGYFVGSDDINYIAIDAESSDLALKVIFHEYSHFLLQNWMGRAPVWVSEGLAEVYATFQTRDGGNSAVLGAPDGAHLQLLQSTTLIPLRELLTIDQSSPTYNEGLRRGVLYAQSWALVHYLMYGNKARAPQLGIFLTAVKSGAPAEQAFRDAFGDVNALDQELKEYIRRVAFTTLRLEFGEKVGGGSSARGEAIPDAQAAAHLGDVLARLGRTDAARAQLRSVLEKDPDVARAACALGLIDLRAAKYDDAIPLLERAATLAPDDPWVQTALGRALLSQFEEPRAEDGSESLLQRARMALTRAADHAGASAHTLALLGRVHLMPGGDLARATSVLERAVQLAPGREDYRLMLARALIDQGEKARATAQLGPLMARGSQQEIRDNARELLGAMVTQDQAAAEAVRSGSGVQSDRPSSATAPAAQSARSQPILRSVGSEETRVRGIFRSVDCQRETVVLNIDQDGQILRFSARRFEDVDFISYRDSTPSGVSCGAQQVALPVLATFRSADPPIRGVDGQAVAIEIVEDDYMLR